MTSETRAIDDRVNGEVKQRSSTAHAHPLASQKIVAHASQAFTLLPGDVILTGTPAGVGRLAAGDTVEVEVEGIGILRNTVARLVSTGADVHWARPGATWENGEPWTPHA